MEYMKLFWRIIPFSLLLFPVFAFAVQFEADLYYSMSSNKDVNRLQEFLRGEGIYNGPITGNFFAITRESVKKFQDRESITPVAGFFGPKTRARANAIINKSSTLSPPSPNDEISLLRTKIKELEEKLKTLQEQSKKEVSTPESLPPPPSSSQPSISFTKDLTIIDKTLLSGKTTFGVRYPYRVRVSWELSKKAGEEIVGCSPSVEVATASESRADIYPLPNAEYKCNVSLKDGGIIVATSDVSFMAPKWISMAGYGTSTFPLVETHPYKIGDISLYNGSSTDVLFSKIEVLIYDEMDSTFNRNKLAYFIFRDGKSALDTLISRTEFTFSLPSPKIGEPHKSQLFLPFVITLKPGEERIVSLWTEQLKYVRSGTLKIDAIKVETTGPAVTGGFSLVLTKEPPL